MFSRGIRSYPIGRSLTYERIIALSFRININLSASSFVWSPRQCPLNCSKKMSLIGEALKLRQVSDNVDFLSKTTNTVYHLQIKVFYDRLKGYFFVGVLDMRISHNVPIQFYVHFFLCTLDNGVVGSSTNVTFL